MRPRLVLGVRRPRATGDAAQRRRRPRGGRLRGRRVAGDHRRPGRARPSSWPGSRRARSRPAVAGDALVIGCDSVLELDGAIHGKPGDADEAAARWRAMRGRSGVLHTGHCLIDTGPAREVARSADTVVHFADLDDDEIDAYVATGEPLRSPARSPSTASAAPSCAASRATRTPSSGSACPLLREMLAELGRALDRPVAGLPGSLSTSARTAHPTSARAVRATGATRLGAGEDERAERTGVRDMAEAEAGHRVGGPARALPRPRVDQVPRVVVERVDLLLEPAVPYVDVERAGDVPGVVLVRRAHVEDRVVAGRDQRDRLVGLDPGHLAPRLGRAAGAEAERDREQEGGHDGPEQGGAHHLTVVLAAGQEAISRARAFSGRRNTNLRNAQNRAAVPRRARSRSRRCCRPGRCRGRARSG